MYSRQFRKCATVRILPDFNDFMINLGIHYKGKRAFNITTGFSYEFNHACF